MSKIDLAANAQLSVRHAAVAYGAVTVLQEVSFHLPPGQIGCLLGPSGCGKTSLLRAIAGFEPLAAGEIRLRGQCVVNTTQMTPPEQRRVGMVFQDFALFPHLNVADNIAFGLRHLPRAARKQRVTALLELVGLPQMAKSYPHQMSGGQQQRVALARAIAPRPELLLLDEPFSSMDAELRQQLARDVRHALQQDGVTGLLVTHDQHEAFAMADVIGVMGDGRLRQWDSAYNLYHHPADEMVAGFIGKGTMLPGFILPDGCIETPLGRIKARQVPVTPQADAEGRRAVRVLFRPDDLLHDESSDLSLEILDKSFLGAESLYTLALPDNALSGGIPADASDHVLSLVESHHDHAIGDRLPVRVSGEAMPVFLAAATSTVRA
ncbi:ABC transporter ATP-binding protein [Magnetofaba australis]|uniref:Putative Ferric iron ABC transporter, ATP-binding protein n=1 Tax=Magnetofaba australis IT-1 TaxID=1434232 RepID=A0A1Y2K8Q2_9PROT|nr:ABC transporter ATP-binding protein [Magnetofaba australis]OSM07130.1 putative Ferric iron ABC transporter, ATP-binding protein [Magnetofaba australis IT-1]